MSWLSKILGYVPKKERAGISLNCHEPWWEVSGFEDFSAFLRSLEELFQSDAVLYLEGTCIAKDVQEFLKAKEAEKKSKVAIGTLWPRPLVFHIPLNHENISGLAVLAEKHALPEICTHLHVYRGNAILLEGHDIFDRFVALSSGLPEAQVQAWCAKLKCTYKKAVSNE